MPSIYFFAAGLFCCLLLAYLLKGGMGLDTCAGWVILTIIHGLLIKPLFVLFDFPSADLLDFVLFQEVTREDYWTWAPAMVLPYFAFFAAMSAAGKYRQPRQVASGTERVFYFSNPALLLFLVVAVVGAVGFFIQFPQLLDSANKNTIASAELEDYNSGGIWRGLVEFSYLIALCSVLNIAVSRSRRTSIFIFMIATGLWLAFCYLSDQRGAILFTVITLLIAYRRYVAGLSGTAIFGIVAATVTVGVVKTITRIQTDGAALQENLGAAVGNFVGQNLIENGKTVAIIQSVPSLLDFQYGFTYLNSLLLLVPRAFFPAKSAVNLDTTIGNQIFGCGAFGACGVPPGLIAESYLNFGVLGVVLLPVAMGYLIGKIDATFRDSHGTSFDVFYLFSLLYLGMAILGSGVSSVITTLVSQGITVAVVCYVCGRSKVLAPAEERLAGHQPLAESK